MFKMDGKKNHKHFVYEEKKKWFVKKRAVHCFEFDLFFSFYFFFAAQNIILKWLLNAASVPLSTISIWSENISNKRIEISSILFGKSVNFSCVSFSFVLLLLFTAAPLLMFKGNLLFLSFILPNL